MHYEKYTLSNGLRVILAPMKETQTATVMLMAGTGSRYETKATSGISHFLEHLFFKGTEKRPTTLAIAEELDAIGGEYNAFTSKDKTAYYAKVDAKHLPTALDVVSDILLHSKFEAAEIDRERGTILQEINMYEDSPARMVAEHFEELLYGNHPLGWQVIGPKANIRRFRRADFINYLKSQYVAGNLVLTVAGKFNPEETKNQISGLFGEFNGGSFRDKKKVNDRQSKPAILVKTKKTDQTHLILGVRAYDIFHNDRFALSLLANILGGNMSSRLFIEVRERRGLAYHVNTYTEAFHDAGYLATQCGVEHGNLKEVLKVILGEYRRIAGEPVSEKELSKAKEYLKAQLVMSLESSDEVAGFLIGQEALKKEILLPKDIAERIDAVTSADVLRVGRDIFQSRKLNLAVIGPGVRRSTLEKITAL